MSPNYYRLLKWAAANNATLFAYGSRVADRDFMLFTDTPFPRDFFGDALAIVSNHSICACSCGELIDLSVQPAAKLTEKWRHICVDMLRNSEPPADLLHDGAKIAESLAAFRDANPRRAVSETEILDALKTVAVGRKFILAKLESGPLHVRYLSWMLQDCLFTLARAYDLRRGGKGKIKGRDLEKIFTPEEVEMLTVDLSLDPGRQAKAYVFSELQIRFWVRRLGMELPDFLE